jgi:hypothetical protein
MLGVFQYLMGLIFLIGVNKFHLDILDLDLTLQVKKFIVFTNTNIIKEKLDDSCIMHKHAIEMTNTFTRLTTIFKKK